MADRRWGRFLLVWAIVLLLLGAAGCYLLYQYLGVYEVTRPDPVAEAYVANAGLDEILKLAKENVHLDVTEFEEPLALYTSYLEAIDLTRAVSCRRNIEQSTDTRLVYDVRTGPALVCNVILVPAGVSPGFGRNYWGVSEVRAATITELLPSVTAVVDTISGTGLQLNGKPLSDAYLACEPGEITDITRFEASEPPSYVSYEVGPLYGEIQLVDRFGVSIAPDGEITDGRVHYAAFEGTQSLQIRAPEDLKVLVNGVELTSKDAVSSSLGVFEGLDLYTFDAACLTNVYRIEGLYRTPVVTAMEKDGSEVTPIASGDNSFTFFHKGEPETEEQFRSIAEYFFNAYMEYSAHAFEYTRFSNLLNRILPGSNLYEYVYRSQEAMYWASGTQTEYSDLRYENFHRVNDFCFVCTVIYSADMTATNWYEQYSYKLENAYELAFVSTNGKWLAGGMTVISE